MPLILVVDDDPKLLKMLQRTLVYENLNVLTATNGLEALPLIEAHKSRPADRGLDDAQDGRARR